MKITDIDRYKGDTFFIETDGTDKIFVNESIVAEFHLKKGMDIPEGALEQVVSENTYRRAKERAFYLLDEREYGFAEMYKKLEKNYDGEICLRVCNKLAELKLIDDRRYARRLAEYYCCRKYFGRYRAKQELMRRGLGSALAEEAVGEFSEGETERLEELVEKKYERFLTDRKGANKVMNALARQGYSYSDIKEVLNMYEYED